MIQRRQFLGALGAACLTAGPLSRSAFANPIPQEKLNWRSEIIRTIPSNRANRAPVVTGVALQPQGTTLAIVGDDHQIGLYDYQDSSLIDHISIHTDWIRATRFSPDGRTLVTAGNDRTVRFWQAGQWDIPRFTSNQDQAIIEIAFSQSGELLATVGFSDELILYQTDGARQAGKFRCACNDNHAVAFSQDGTMLAAGGRNGVIRVWNIASGKLVTEVKPHRQRIRSLDFTPTGKLISAGDDQLVHVIDLERQHDVIALPRHASKLYCTAILSDGLFATGGSDNQIHIWQLNDQSELGTLAGHTGTVSCLDFNESKLVSGSFDTHVRIWHTERFTSAPEQRHTQRSTGWNGRFN